MHDNIVDMNMIKLILWKIEWNEAYVSFATLSHSAEDDSFGMENFLRRMTLSTQHTCLDQSDQFSVYFCLEKIVLTQIKRYTTDDTSIFMARTRSYAY